MNKDISLVIDTTQDTCYLLLVCENKLFDYSIKPTHNNMTDIVVNEITTLFNKNNLSIKNNLKTVYLVNGPGSFTGCRVGYIVASTLKNILNCKLYTISSLLFNTKEGTGISILDARGDKLYFAIYENYQAIQKPILIDKAKLNSFIEKYDQFKTFINYQNIDFKQNFLTHQTHFKLVESLEQFEPLYLKNPI